VRATARALNVPSTLSLPNVRRREETLIFSTDLRFRSVVGWVWVWRHAGEVPGTAALTTAARARAGRAVVTRRGAVRRLRIDEEKRGTAVSSRVV
jgi:hypothetical protein